MQTRSLGLRSAIVMAGVLAEIHFDGGSGETPLTASYCALPIVSPELEVSHSGGISGNLVPGGAVLTASDAVGAGGEPGSAIPLIILFI